MLQHYNLYALINKAKSERESQSPHHHHQHYNGHHSQSHGPSCPIDRNFIVIACRDIDCTHRAGESRQLGIVNSRIVIQRVIGVIDEGIDCEGDIDIHSGVLHLDRIQCGESVE